MSGTRDVTLFIDPFSYHFLQDRLFDPAMDVHGGDDILRPWRYLRDWFEARGVRVHTADRLVAGAETGEANVYVSLGYQEHIRALASRDDVLMSAFFAFEAPIVEPSLYRNLGWIKDEVRRIYSFSTPEGLAPFLDEPIELEPFCIPWPYDDVDESLWASGHRDFLVMINGNKLPRLYVNELYTERLRAIEFFERTGEIDLYGIGWDVPPFRPYPRWVPNVAQRAHRGLIAAKQKLRPDPLLAAARRVYRGPVLNKPETLAKYTFAICFENQVLDGWITEKIFDCLRVGTIPVYLGPADIEAWVPAECFVDMRRFTGYEALRDYLKSLGPREVDGYRRAGREYLGSKRFFPFSKQAFVDRLAGIVEEDTGIQVG